MMRLTHDHLMAQLSEFVASHIGLHFPPSAWRDLERGAAATAAELGLSGPDEFVRLLLTPPLVPERVQVLAQYLTIGETYFFREKPALDALEHRILPELIAARRSTIRQLRIWSAACCTGEEPYTLAIILTRLLPDLNDWNITILGTDVNSHFLKIASAGQYREWSFRATPAPIKDRYFSREGDKYAIDPDIKRMVTFAHLNLAEDRFPSLATNTTNIDVLFCRNALMYFTPDCATEVISRFHRSLVAGGWLIVSATEASPALFQQFEMVPQPDAVLYRKAPGSSHHIEARAAPSPWQATRATIHPVAAPRTGAKQPGPSPIGLRPESPAAPKSPAPDTRPPAPDPWHQARTLYMAGRYAEARDKLQALVEQGLQEPRAFTLLARIEADQGRLAEALHWCDRALSIDRQSPAYWYLRATILQEQGSLEEATRDLKRVLYLDPTFVLAHFVLGNLALQQGRSAESARHFDSARSLLRNLREDEVISDVEGLTVGQLDSIIASMMT
jgi:chemotaxis protein methyltransferase CheR